MKRLALALPFIILGACATVPQTPEQVAASCAATDWRGKGYKAGFGAKGFADPPTARERCAELGILPDIALFQAGWDAGVRDYCTPLGIFETALKRDASLEVCDVRDPALPELAALGAAHRMAESRLRSAESHLEGLHRDIRRRRKKIAKHEGRIEGWTDELADPATPDAAKPEIEHAIVKFEDKIAKHRKRIRRARRAIPEAESDLRVAAGLYDESAAFVEVTLAELSALR